MKTDITTFKHIAYVISDFKEKFGIPRQSGKVKSARAKIVFYPEYRSKDAIRGLKDFEYIWLLFDFSKAHVNKFTATVRPPRLGGNEKVGVFASRSPFRPNPIGLSSVKLIDITFDEILGPVLTVEGADLLDGTPLFDIKPYIPFTDSHEDCKYGYSEENKDYFLTVKVDCEIPKELDGELYKTAIDCIKEDPRPAYNEDEERIFGMRYGDFDFKFKVNCGVATVIQIIKSENKKDR